MKKKLFVIALLALPLCAWAGNHKNNNVSKWDKYPLGKVIFTDKDKVSNGAKIYHKIIPNPEVFIQTQAKKVLNTLYYSPKDSIPPVYTIDYTIENADGISAKGGDHGNINIWYSTRHVERSFNNNDTAKVLYETAGVLFHELTHAYQLEPQGIGNYGSNKVFWSFIEGMADAVRVANGYFHPEDRPKGGSYMDGYRYVGFFLVWVRDHYDKNFLRKFNRSTLEVIPWSYNAAFQKILGKKNTADALWHKYQVAMGDIKE